MGGGGDGGGGPIRSTIKKLPILKVKPIESAFDKVFDVTALAPLDKALGKGLSKDKSTAGRGGEGLPAAPGEDTGRSAADRARILERRRQGGRKGRRSTILTGPQGLDDNASVERKTLLGG